METKFKFTPGPWKLNEHFTLISETTKNEIVFGCGLTMCGRVTKDGEIGANAKLIASAPDMLDCLNEMTNYMHGLDSSGRVIFRIPQELSKKIGKTLNKIIK